MPDEMTVDNLKEQVVALDVPNVLSVHKIKANMFSVIFDEHLKSVHVQQLRALQFDVHDKRNWQQAKYILHWIPVVEPKDT